MRSLFAIVPLAFSLVTAAGGDESLPDHCIILPISEGPALMKQCSRGAPKDVDAYWSPSISQVLEVEQHLLELLREGSHDLTLSASYRQYIGITVHGKNLIYLNSIDRSALTGDWRTKAAVICDGGDLFWGVVWDPGDSTFHDLQFNGGG